MPSSKSQQLSGQISAVFGGNPGLLEVPVEFVFKLKLVHAQFGISEDDPEHVVEIMSDATSETTDRFHLLRVQELHLQFFPFRLGTAALADILDEDQSAVPVGKLDCRGIDTAGKERVVTFYAD